MELITFKLTSLNAIEPTKAYYGDLGFDLYSAEDITVPSSFVLNKLMSEELVGDYSKKTIRQVAFNNATLVSTDVICEFPENVGGLIRDRSSIATKTGLIVVAGVIDSGYRNVIKIAFRNLGESYQIKKHDKIAQLILVPVLPYGTLSTSAYDVRDIKGFGSSGA